MPRRRYSGDDGTGWAILGASLQELSRSLVEGSERSRVRERQSAQDAETRRYHDILDADRDEARRLQEQAAARAKRDDAAQQLEQLRADVGGGGVDIDPALADTARSYATTAGRPGALVPQVRTPMAPMSAAAAAAGDPIAAAVFGLPTVSMQFRRNPAEEKLRAAEQQTTQGNALLDELMAALPPATQQAIRVGRATGKMPVFQPDDLTAPKTPEQLAAEQQAKAEREFGDWKRRQDYQEGQVRSREAARGIQPRQDDPRMPRGVRAYLGQLATKYRGDAAAAGDELQRALPSLQEQHPDLDLATLRQQFNAAFPKPTDDEGLGTPIPRMAAPAATPPAAAPAASPIPGAQRPPAGPPAGAQAAPQVGALQQQIRAAMQAGDKAKVAALRAEYLRLTRGQ